MVQKWPVEAAFLLLAKFSQKLDYYYFVLRVFQSKNAKILVKITRYLYFVGKNIKGWLKIRISCLVCSQIWLTFLRMMATFSTSSSGWLSLWLQEKDSYENHWTAEASNLFSMQRKPDPILEVPRIQNKLTSNSPTTSGEKRKERSPWCTKILFWLQG